MTHDQETSRIKQEPDANKSGVNLLENLKPLSTHGWLEIGQARYVTAWPCKARDRAITDRVGNLHKDNRY